MSIPLLSHVDGQGKKSPQNFFVPDPPSLMFCMDCLYSRHLWPALWTLRRQLWYSVWIAQTSMDILYELQRHLWLFCMNCTDFYVPATSFSWIQMRRQVATKRTRIFWRFFGCLDCNDAYLKEEKSVTAFIALLASGCQMSCGHYKNALWSVSVAYFVSNCCLLQAMDFFLRVLVL